MLITAKSKTSRSSLDATRMPITRCVIVATQMRKVSVFLICKMATYRHEGLDREEVIDLTLAYIKRAITI
jgi:hypothetical protein